MELNELRKIAEQATQDVWYEALVGPGEEEVWIVDSGTSYICSTQIGDDRGAHDSIHIATFDPPTVLALITELETFRRRFDAMRRQRDGYRNQLRKTEQQVARARELHSITFHDKWARTSLEPVGHGGWCSNCGRFDGDSCPTIRALDGDGRG